MPESADLEFELVWDAIQDLFNVSLRFTSTKNVDQHAHSTFDIDKNVLDGLVNKDDEYAAALTDMVFGSAESKDGPAEAQRFYSLAVAAAQFAPVHFRLEIDGPTRFHDVRWELLRDPINREHPVATSGNVLFSRYLSSPDWRPVLITSKHEPRALIVIANPADLDQYPQPGRRLPPVAVEAELARAQEALDKYHTVALTRPGEASLDNLISRLNDGFDILYLVAHGTLRNGNPLIFLEREDHTAHPVDASQVVERVAALPERPTVIFLSSCQSAGAGAEQQSEDGGALLALGPGLAEAGVAAVIAMQGNITMRTAGDFAPVFFREFLADGVVDRAMAKARDKVRGRPDWWVPVLFSRLRFGQTHYAAQFSDAGRAQDTWDDLRAMMGTGRLIPVLGPGLADGILGSRQEIAFRWVRRWRMPIAEYAQGDLAQVAQYLRVGRTPARVTAELEDYLKTELRERQQNAQGEDPFLHLPRGLIEDAPEKAIEEVGRVLRERDPGDPFSVVAALPVKVFVTTGWTDLLQKALRARDKVPETRCFRWTDRANWTEPKSKVTPTIEAPLVYHLFGRLDSDDSLVLTVDDYFEWLTGWIGDRKTQIPPGVRAALSNSSLLFLGFGLDDWDFRVVFQSIKSFAGATQKPNQQHIGVQLKPENRVIEPESAQRYLESYFNEDLVNIYWADTRTFLDELRTHIGIKI